MEGVLTTLPIRALDHMKFLCSDTFSGLGDARFSGTVATVKILLALTFRRISIFNSKLRGPSLELDLPQALRLLAGK